MYLEGRKKARVPGDNPRIHGENMQSQCIKDPELPYYRYTKPQRTNYRNAGIKKEKLFQTDGELED